MKAKKLLLSLLSFICVAFSVLTVASCATEGLEYKLSDDHESAVVSGYKGLSSKVVIPSKYNGFSVTSIGDGAFRNCEFIQSVKIPNSVTSIKYEAFKYCYSLTSIKIPDNVTSIGSSAFYGCSSLTSIAIPDGITIIDRSTFEYCSSLESITIPDSVTFIEPYAFSDCDSLKTVFYTGTYEQWNELITATVYNGQIITTAGNEVLKYVYVKCNFKG